MAAKVIPSFDSSRGSSCCLDFWRADRYCFQKDERTVSRIPGFVKVACTIRRHLDDIVAYIRWRMTNGLVEGLHNKIRVITRRAFGFHSAEAVIGVIMPCCIP